MTEIGVIGLGRMGSAVARTLIANGTPLLLWNRTRSRAEQIAAATIAASAQEALARCRLVLLIVFDHAALEGLLKANGDRLGGHCVAMLTDVAPRESAALATLVTQAGGSYVEAQIYATADEVAARRAWVLIAGRMRALYRSHGCAEADRAIDLRYNRRKRVQSSYAGRRQNQDLSYPRSARLSSAPANSCRPHHACRLGRRHPGLKRVIPVVEHAGGRPHTMRILLSNDDGYFAPGLATLAEALAALGDVVVVAPERDRSGASNSLTLDRPLAVRTSHLGFHYVNGTPTDCVHLAVTGLLDHLPDMVVSGINHGANMGDDTIYSGTVAAATEGFLLGIPSIAMSLASKAGGNYPAAARVAVDLVTQFRERPVPQPVLLNVNVPDLPYHELKGTRITRLGRRHKAEGVIRSSNPRGETVYWIGAAGDAQDAGEGTDFHAVAHGFVSITPLQIDLTHFAQLGQLAHWLAAEDAPGLPTAQPEAASG